MAEATCRMIRNNAWYKTDIVITCHIVRCVTIIWVTSKQNTILYTEWGFILVFCFFHHSSFANLLWYFLFFCLVFPLYITKHLYQGATHNDVVWITNNLEPCVQYKFVIFQVIIPSLVRFSYYWLCPDTLTHI